MAIQCERHALVQHFGISYQNIHFWAIEVVALNFWMKHRTPSKKRTESTQFFGVPNHSFLGTRLCLLRKAKTKIYHIQYTFSRTKFISYWFVFFCKTIDVVYILITKEIFFMAVRLPLTAEIFFYFSLFVYTTRALASHPKKITKQRRNWQFHITYLIRTTRTWFDRLFSRQRAKNRNSSTEKGRKK